MGEAKEGNEVWREYLKHLLRENDKALVKALVIIARNEMTATQAYGKSGWRPGAKGFNRYDRDTLMNTYESFCRCHRLSENQMNVLRAALPKYWKQLKEAAVQKQLLKERLRVPSEDEGSWQYNHKAKELQLCLGSGTGCEYGICDECPALIGKDDADD